jgi:autotransporter-associated beta strand protein
MQTRLILHRAVLLGLLPFICLGLRAAEAGSATWNLNPTTGDWNTATNWTPATVPNSVTDIATFSASNTTSVLSSTNIDLASLIFAAGAPPYTIATARSHASLTFWKEGIRNDSGIQQIFTGIFSFNGTSSAGDNLTYDGGTISFNDNARAGSASFDDTHPEFFDNASADHGVFTNATLVFHNNSTAANGIFVMAKNGGGSVAFFDSPSAGEANFTISSVGIAFDMWGGTLGNATVTVNGEESSDTFARMLFSATADHATLIANGGIVPGVNTAKGVILFQSGATAAEATLIINPTTVAGAPGAHLEFSSGASAGDSSITVNGAAVTGEMAEGVLTFQGGPLTTAANTTIVATAGSAGGKGALVQFLPNSIGGTCRIDLLGNSQLDIDPHRERDLTIGSLEGEGTVTVSGGTGGNTLIIGSNNLSTTFGGGVQGTGAITKIGTGTLTLTGANIYTGGTKVPSGVLLVSNASGSGTGTGAVTVSGGTLGGSGIISGAVTVGTNTNTASFLAPSKGAKRPATLAIQGALTLNDDSTYLYKLDTKHRVSDQILAQGVAIDDGAKFSLRPAERRSCRWGRSSPSSATRRPAQFPAPSTTWPTARS